MRCLARHHALQAEIAELDEAIAALSAAVTPRLLAARGVGPEVASALFVAAGDNPDRMTTTPASPTLCGASPVEASSRRITRHRLNRGGNCQANEAPWRIVMVRLTCDPGTQASAARRRAEGKTDPQIMPCLKRYDAREILRGHRRSLPALTCVPAATPQASRSPLRPTTSAHGPPASANSNGGLLHDNDLAQRLQYWFALHGQPSAA